MAVGDCYVCKHFFKKGIASKYGICNATGEQPFFMR